MFRRDQLDGYHRVLLDENVLEVDDKEHIYKRP
jgi:hypothetical protein